MHRTSTLLLTIFAVLFSTAGLSQAVTLSRTDWIPSPETGVIHGPVLAKDNYGNLYQATTVHQGTFQGDFILAKYNGLGVAQWSVLWSSYGFQDDEVTAITTDRLGNVIVTGTTSVPLWAGGPYTVAMTLKYNPYGALLWAVQTRIGQMLTAPACITTDFADNILIGGTAANTTADSTDFFVQKLDSTGRQWWAVTYDGTAGRIDQVTAIATDASANVYITGESMGQVPLRLPSGRTFTFPEGFDYETIKYNPNGQTLWANRYSTTAADIPTAMTLDTAGNVYVTGSSGNYGTTVCYNSTGAQQWVLRSDTAQTYTSLALDPSGNVVTAGYNINAGALNYILTKCTAAGSLTWSMNVGAGPYVPLNYGPYLALAIDRESNIYISGEAITSGTDSAQNLNFWTLKYTSAGTGEWSQIFRSPYGGGNIPSSIAVIESSSRSSFTYPMVFVGGFSNIGDGFAELTLLTYTQSYYRTIIRSTGANSVTGENEAPDNNTRAAALSNYPNPFRRTTNVAYTLPNDSHVILQIFDVTGKTIATLVNDDETAGSHTVPYNSGRLAAGIYEYRIVATSPQGNFTSTKQMIIQ